MGVDYNGVGGIGIYLEPKHVEHAIDNGFFSQEDWDLDPDDPLSRLHIRYATVGDSWSGHTDTVLLCSGKTLGEINANAEAFSKQLKHVFGIEIAPEDLPVISDMHIW